MRTLATSVALAASCFLAAQPVLADVKLPAIISNNMVLQSDKPLPIWGTADAGEKVTVTIADQKAEATADDKGAWKVTLKPLKAGDAVTMTVAGKNSINVGNILVGSVWICSGQSNMQFGLNGAHNAAAEVPKANYPKIRLFTVPNITSLTPLSDVKGQWVECTPKTAPGFSAVGYFFGRDVHEATGFPVGLIHTSWGGTPAEAWTSYEGLEKDKELAPYVTSIDNAIHGAPGAQEKYVKDLAAYEVEKKKWDVEVGEPFQDEMKEYQEGVKKARAERTPEPGKPILSRPAPKPPADPSKAGISPGTPTVLYNAMIAPLIPFAIEGAIWYQGEANAGAADLYRTLFPRMITDWRERWAEGDFPFLFVQLANWLPRKETPVDEPWAHLREAQNNTLKLPHTGMAVIIDIGDAADIHPRDKMDVGHRLALWALRDTFGKKIVASGPLYSGMKIEDNKIRISFTELGTGLAIGGPPAGSGLESKPGDELVGFAIAGEDGKYVWAKAVIDGESVVVSSDQVAKPANVRYAWANNPACNLYNKEGLPASPFRTEAWAPGK
jgi:sialate O-acetylesterase